MAAAVLAIGGGVTVAALGSDPAPAHADALCDQMRAQYGSNWPCISVPTNTFQPTTNTPAPTTGANGAGSGGPQVGSNIGPGPGEGNGTPIVTVPGQAAPQPPPGVGNGGPAPTTPNAGGVRPTASQPVPPGDTTGQVPVVPSIAVPAVTPVPGAVTANPEPGTPPHALDSGSKQPDIPLAAWVVAGAAAFATANPRARRAASAGGLRSWSLLRRGGSERATVGQSQLVLINDPSSPKSYVFQEDVPPGGHIGVNPDGSATVYDATGKPVSQIAKPWAFDAAGRPQKTWYTVDENGDLVQHVEPAPNALYPILADPYVWNGSEWVWTDPSTLEVLPSISQTPGMVSNNPQGSPPAGPPPQQGVTAQDIPDVLGNPPTSGNPTVTSSGNTWGADTTLTPNGDGTVTGSNTYWVTPKYGDLITVTRPLTAEQQQLLTTLIPNSRVETAPNGDTVFTPTTQADGLTAQDIVNLTNDMPEPGQNLRLQNGGNATVTRMSDDAGVVYDTLHLSLANGQTFTTTTVNKALSVDHVEHGESPLGTPSERVVLQDGSSSTRYSQTIPELGNRTVDYLEVRDTTGKLIYTVVTWDEGNQEYGYVRYGDGTNPNWIQYLTPDEIATLNDPTPEEALNLRERIGEHVRNLEENPDAAPSNAPDAMAQAAGGLAIAGTGLSTEGTVASGPLAPWVLGAGVLLLAAGGILAATSNDSSPEPGRNELGQFTDGNGGSNNGKAAEDTKLDELEQTNPGHSSEEGRTPARLPHASILRRSDTKRRRHLHRRRDKEWHCHKRRTSEKL
ncbi:hypothetical protein [Gordonia polyisoprenivorans]|uniref:hypothetical protein n=1 Tax=Gordonia polyisoprenivorans TaxID=84595 RepID=UPI001AD6D732|nr:hypothetical protein [Gordonia polyisoprenivorans]QTI69860.1 hypothetical protein J6U32_04485 [Gordonia polyisoprenivorans]